MLRRLVNSAGIRRPPKTPSGARRTPTSRGSVPARRDDADFIGRRAVVAATGDAARSNLVQRGEAGLVDRAEHGVVGRQQRITVDQEELAAVGTRSGIGHRHCAPWIDDGLLQRRVAWPVLRRRVLVGELISRSAGSIALGVSAL